MAWMNSYPISGDTCLGLRNGSSGLLWGVRGELEGLLLIRQHIREFVLNNSSILHRSMYSEYCITGLT